ncbi:type IV secretion system protein VirB10 [Roseateles sp.]|uniref:type IV secretion system protein VirB10 n=1 Tax=Roseateles sp. TaxID=1971397 RepID=UPI0039EB23C1
MTADPQPAPQPRPDGHLSDGHADRPPGDDGLSPLSGEPGIPDVAAASRSAVSSKGLLAVAMLVLSLVVVCALAIHRFAANTRHAGAEDRLNGDKPVAAAAEPRRLEMPARPPASPAPSAAPRVPALVPDLRPAGDEEAEPIGVRRSNGSGSTGSGQAAIPPEDAPVLLVSTSPMPLGSAAPSMHAPSSQPSASGEAPSPHGDATAASDVQGPLAATSRNLQAYQRQLQGLLDNLARPTGMAAREGDNAGTSPPGLSMGLPSPAPSGQSPAGQAPALFGGQLLGSATPRVSASLLGNRSLTLPKGAAFTCALKTRVISAASGLVGCQVQRNVYGDDGRVLLIERGSHLDGEYRIATVRPGMVRIPVLWTRLRTPPGVTVDIASPATGPLGESGIDGHVDNRWTERLGAAMLLSLIDDSVKVVIQNQANERQGDTIVLPSTTANTSRLAEKVLDSTINIPPLVYRNHGGIVGIYVARDIDFSSVYELAPSATAPAVPPARALSP